MKCISLKTKVRALFCILALTIPTWASAKIVLKDPKKDDKGPGKYTYPTHSSYKAGDFDLVKVTLEEKGDNIEIRVHVRSSVRDVWKSRNWNPPGNGFSVQFVQIYIDTDHKAGSGVNVGLPGLNVRFAKQSRWEKVILISPQGKTRLKSEINLKAKKFKDKIIIPTSTRAQGKKLIAVVPKAKLGGLSKSWGFQVVMQSNEGFPRKKDLLTRTVNEYNGKHRFGGGNDGDCDPHVIDMLAGKAKGASSEKAAQYKALTYSCGKEKKRAVLPMVYLK